MSQPSSRPLCEFIRENSSRILEVWEQEVRQLPSARHLSSPRLLDHVPNLLELMAAAIQSVHTGEPRTLEGIPEIHALLRLDEGYDLEQVVQEYAALRSCIIRLYGQFLHSAGAHDISTTLVEVERLNRLFDDTISASVTRYSKARERTLVALGRVSEAVLGAEELDAMLPRLLRIIKETTESVDTVTLLLLEGDTLRVRASLGLEAEVVANFSLRVGEGFAGTIAANRQPLELSHAAQDPLLKSDFIRLRGIRALYGVPLTEGDRLIGVAHMGSLTAYSFSQENKILFRLMTSRATSLILQAQLIARERALREELATREQLLRLLVEQSGDAVIMADEHGVLRIFNPAAERQHGVAYQEVNATRWASTYGLLSLEGRPLAMEETPLYRALKGEQVTDARWRVRHPDGTLRTLTGTASPLRRPDGSSAGAVLTTRDETERLEQEAALAETVALLDTLLDTAPVGLAFVDRELCYTRLNQLLADQQGVPVKAALGRRLREATPLLAFMEPYFRRVLRTGQPLVDIESTSMGVTHAGQPRHWLLSYYPVRNPRGHVSWVGAVVVDITERKEAERALQQAAEFRERFLGIVSHDLRNPLNAILLSASTLLRAEALSPLHARALQRIAASAERMGRMIGDLLDLTRGRLGGGIPLSLRPCDLSAITQHVIEELEASHPGRQLRMRAEGNLHGEWDPDRLTQLLGNLGKNALDYSPESTPVDLLLQDNGDTVLVEVHNMGAPIPAEQLASLFEPFRRPKQHDSSRSGLGLGLFIVDQIARAHSGTVGVRSSEGEGSTFRVTLPRHAARQAPSEHLPLTPAQS